MRLTTLALALASLSLAAADTPAAKPQAAAPTPTPAAAPPAPGALKPFAEIIKDAKESAGLFGIWQKDEKVWIELKPEHFGPLYFLSWNFPRAIGERGLYGGMMGDAQIVYFKRLGNTLQLMARNTAFVAAEGTPSPRPWPRASPTACWPRRRC